MNRPGSPPGGTPDAPRNPDPPYAREAVDRALRYLSHRPRSRFELERHLRHKGYGEEAVEAALERCAELGYLDDGAFAAAYARDRIRLRPRAPALMEAELRRKGVSSEDARRGIARALEDEDTSEEVLLRRAAGRRWRVLRGRDPEVARRKLLGYLARRGFRAAAARDVVETLLAEAGGSASGERGREDPSARDAITPDPSAE